MRKGISCTREETKRGEEHTREGTSKRERKRQKKREGRKEREGKRKQINKYNKYTRKEGTNKRMDKKPRFLLPCP
jgi:hypothetical protein